MWASLLNPLMSGPLIGLDTVDRLALEMAVTEDVELRSLQDQAIRLRPAWRHAERIAAIADSLLLPKAITDWLATHRRGVPGNKSPGARPADGKAGS